MTLALRLYIILLAIILLSLVIWYGGPYLAFGSMQPFDTVTERLVAIGVLVLLIVLWTVLKQLNAKRAANQLAKDMTAGAEKQQGRGAQDAAQLRARFDEALSALRESKGKSVSLYELPWYVIIGPPGAGKTTALKHSGLVFPYADSSGGGVRGVGGTRNCDWWFTDQAVLIDTAGR